MVVIWIIWRYNKMEGVEYFIKVGQGDFMVRRGAGSL